MSFQKYQDAANHIITDLPHSVAVEIITGLIDLANENGPDRGYRVVVSDDPGESCLEDQQCIGDCNPYLKGYTVPALKFIAQQIELKEDE